MFDKTKQKILEKIIKDANPNRDISVEKIGKRFFMHNNDQVGCRDYLLKGKYTYDQVIELNNLTGYSAGFGYCKELGPVAFIGVPNKNCVQNSGYFYYKVHAYGEPINNDEYYFDEYSDEDAKRISNYTVYGMGNPKVLKGMAPIEKVEYFYDYRYQIKDTKNGELQTDILAMDIKLGGTYNFYDARYLAYGSRDEFKGASGENVPIQFAIVGENEPVGIMGLWRHYDNMMFRDVWGTGESEPTLKPIRFLSDEEAVKITDFKLYFFVPTHSFGKKEYITEKVDRTMDRNFDFMMEDGIDYRLQEVDKGKALSKSLQQKN